MSDPLAREPLDRQPMNYAAWDGLAQALFEESGDALFLFDPGKERFLDVNSRAQRLTAFPLRDLLQLPLTELFRPGGTTRLRELREAAGGMGPISPPQSYLLRTLRTEVWIPVTVTVARLHVKPRSVTLITVRDPHECADLANQLQEAHHELRNVRRELHAVLASLPECPWSAHLDEVGRLSYLAFSPVAELIAGRRAEFFLAGMHRWWSIIHPDDRLRWETSLLTLRKGQPTEEEYRVIRADGICRWVRENIQASQPTHGGKAFRLDGTIRDITSTRWQDADSGRLPDR